MEKRACIKLQRDAYPVRLRLLGVLLRRVAYPSCLGPLLERVV